MDTLSPDKTPIFSKLEYPTQYVTFQVGKTYFGIPVARVQEITRIQPMTSVPLAPLSVSGLINLRGQILTAIDMRSMLKIEHTTESEALMNIVVHAAGETISLLVDKIGDVIEADNVTYEQTPETIPIHIARIINGVLKLEKRLLLILNVDACLSMEAVEL